MRLVEVQVSAWDGAPAEGTWVLPVERRSAVASGLLFGFLGPVGWLLLVALDGPERSVRLPISRVAADRLRAARRRHRLLVAAWSGVVGVAVVVAVLVHQPLAVVVALLVGGLGYLVLDAGDRTVRPVRVVEARGGGRVVLGAHPAFAAAVDALPSPGGDR